MNLCSSGIVWRFALGNSSRRNASTFAIEGFRRDVKTSRGGGGGGGDEAWQTILKGLESKWSVEYKGYRQSNSRSPSKSRVQTLLERATRFESVRGRNKESESAAIHVTREFIDFDDAEIHFSDDVLPMYRHIVQGDEESAWKLFREVTSGGKQGKPSASIWHWYIMIGLVARDSTVSLKNVFRMAWQSDKIVFKESPIYASLEDPNELGGVMGQQRVLAFTLMHNLRKRMTEQAHHAVLSVWKSMSKRGISPSSRHVNAACVSLIHLDRQDEAMVELFKTMRPTIAGHYREDPYGWLTGKDVDGAQMNQYTVGMIMFALLTEGFPKRAYELYRISISAVYAVPIHCVPLNLLLWAGRQSYQGIASCQKEEEEDAYSQYSPSSDKKAGEGLATKDLSHWRSQAIWDGHPSAIQARHIFKTYLFRSHPGLKDVVNPLYEPRAGDQSGMLWKTHARMQRWSQNVNSMIAPLIRWESNGSDATLLNVPVNDKVTESNTLVVDEITFNYYLELLPYVSIFEEVPWEEYIIVLAWMKQLNIKPGQYCLLRICWALDHLVPPAAEFASCAGPLHDYLVEWIGEERIPTRAEMNAFERKQRY